MRTVADIIFGLTGQTIFCDAPEGRPSSVTSVKVWPWSSSDVQTVEAAVGTPTVETYPNTTTSAASGPSQSDPTLIPLTTTTGCTVGRRYGLAGIIGNTEWVEVDQVASGVSVNAKHPLHNEHATGRTFFSTRMTATIDPTWVAATDNLIDAGPNPAYRVRWEYVVGGLSYVQDGYFNLVRYGGRHGVFPQDVDDIAPGWLDRLPIDHRRDQGKRLIDEAFREVKIDLHAVNLDDDEIAESEIIDELTRYKAAGNAAVYQQRLDALLRITIKVPVREVATAAARPAQSVGLSRR